MKITACFASSLDGKIAPPGFDHFVRLGTDADIAHLLARRDESDAIVFGAGTFRTHPKLRLGHDQTRRLLHVLLTRSFDLPVDVPMFKQAAELGVPVVIASPNLAAVMADPEQFSSLKQRFPEFVQWQPLNPDAPLLSLRQFLENYRHPKGHALAGQPLQNVLFEGGGIVFNQALQARIIDELWLTITPRLIGGEDTPALLDGPALPVISEHQFGVTTEILSLQQVGNEIYARYKICY